MRYLAALVCAASLLVAAEARAAECFAGHMEYPSPPGTPYFHCDEYGPSTPTGWTKVDYTHQPAPREVKLCHKTAAQGYGWCFKRLFPTGNTVVGSLGELEGPYQVKSYWFNTTYQSTTYSQESLACPTCTTVPAGLNGWSNDSTAYVIRNIVVRN